MTQTNSAAAELVRAMYTAGLTGDFDGFFDRIGDDLVLEEPAFLPYGGTFHGHAGMQEVLSGAQQVLDYSTMRIVEAFGEGLNATVVVEVNLLTDGSPRVILEHWKIRDGQVRWGRVYWFDPTLPD